MNYLYSAPTSSFTSPSPASPFLIHPGGPLPSHSGRCMEGPAVGLERSTLAKYDKELVIIPSPVPQTVFLPLSQDGALSHRNRNKWLEGWEREGRGKLLIRLWCWTLHTLNLWSHPQYLLILALLHWEPLCVYTKKLPFLCFVFVLRIRIFNQWVL